MSHTGNRKYHNIRRLLGDRVEYKPTKVIIDPNIKIEGNHNGDEFTGIFSGNGEKVLIGLSDMDNFIDDVFDGAQKGVAIGYLENSTHFAIYTNDGMGNPVTITTLSKFKDTVDHNFIIRLYSDRITIIFDGEENTLSTNIPVLGDNLKLITVGLY